MIEVAPGLLEAWSAGSGGCHVVLRGVDDAALARRAMAAAAKALYRVPHPEEPEDPFISFVSRVSEAEGGGVTFWFDAADAEVYDGVLDELLGAVVDALQSAGVTDGRLSA